MWCMRRVLRIFNDEGLHRQGTVKADEQESPHEIIINIEEKGNTEKTDDIREDEQGQIAQHDNPCCFLMADLGKAVGQGSQEDTGDEVAGKDKDEG